jgi:gluconate 2-dehydrogenase alpha chain
MADETIPRRNFLRGAGASVVNRYLQSWDVSNLFVMGGAVFPQNAGHNPTATIGALAYWSAKAIT